MREQRTYQMETMRACQPEYTALINLYYEDQNIYDGLPHPDYDWDHYYGLQDQGKLLLVTCRNGDNRLIGVALYVVTPHPHYRGMVWAFCDTLAVDPSQRRRGIGRTLAEAAMLQLKERGVRFVTNNHRTVYEVVPLFPKLGFRLMEHCYIKELV